MTQPAIQVTGLSWTYERSEEPAIRDVNLTVGAGELTADEYRAGAGRVGRLVRWLQPALVLFVGLDGWRAAVDRRARPGLQPGGFGGARAYVMPSTSGRNAHARLAELADHMKAALAASGEG